MQPLHTIDPDKLQYITAIATDVDGTLTDSQGEFSAELINMLQRLSRHSIHVILMTGRPASWIQAFVQYLPVSGGIGENGGIWCPKKSEAPMILLENLTQISSDEIRNRRETLRQIFGQIATEFPRLTPTADCVTRLTDWAFPIHGLSEKELVTIEEICRRNNHSFTSSSIHGHIKHPQQNKAWGIEKLIQLKAIPELSQQTMITVGDSKNDQEMFDQKKFPNSIGVANIRKHEKHMTMLPAYVTEKEGVDGFLEIGKTLLRLPKQAIK